MCGISGIFNWNKKEEISRNILDNMLEKIKHRGPDGKDMYVDEPDPKPKWISECT